MKIDTKFLVSLHEKGMKSVKGYRAHEIELIEVLKQIDEFKVYRSYKYPNLQRYVVLCWGFPEDKAYELITVSRACQRFLKLNNAISCGQISVSKARRIVPILNESNQEEWLKKAHLNSHRELERLIASKNPETEFRESARYVSENQVEVKITMTKEDYEEFKRSQELLCQKEKRPMNLYQTLKRLNSEFLKRNDPIQKATRILKKKTQKQQRQPGTCRMTKQQDPILQNHSQKISPHNKSKQRTPIPVLTFYQATLRDKGQCQQLLPNGQKCLEAKWVDIHHIKHIKDGGTHDLENLITLCKGHHQIEHWTS